MHDALLTYKPSAQPSKTMLCLSCSIGTTNLKNPSGLLILSFFNNMTVNSHQASHSNPPPLSSECQGLSLQSVPTSALSDLLLLWRIASGNPPASLIESISNSFQILSVHSFLKFVQEEFSKLSHLHALPQQIYGTLLKSLQEKLYFQMKV